MSTPAPEAETSYDVCYRHPDRPSYIHCQRCGRTICPQCQTQAAVGVQCPECVREGRAELAASRGGILGRLVPQGAAPIVSYLLIGLCVLAYLGQLLSGGALTDPWALNPSKIATEPWQLLTSAFIHANPIHILFNLYALFIFGPVLERFLGRARYLAMYLIGALGGSVGVVLVYQLAVITNGASASWLGGLLAPASALGASGAIFALIGGLLVLHRAIGLQPTQIVVVVVVNLAFGFFVRGIAWQAHLGGFAVGAAIAAVYLATRRPQQKSAQILSVAGIAVALAVVLTLCVVSQPGAYA
ncbi:rhomboid family intramembrane serine protease [Lysinimonas soli]|uniref:Rhomboid family intramembrane serine protease n=1 Tax=Lysinimonas soli TaxID=1074233 RepID=A0ABW0NPP9_9MICO